MRGYVGGEPVADLRVRYSAAEGHCIARSQIPPPLIDEFPVLSSLPACAEGRNHMRGAQELRVKESDRIRCNGNGLAR